MKIFLSWSGTESKQLASIFKEWLPNVLQYVEPYMSAEDISLGERWNNNITDSLHESIFGLIFVTPSNINAPWINFEAGALSKTLDSKVVPILYNADVMILNEGPLKQFQSAKNLKKDSIYSLLQSINNANVQLKLDEQRLEKSFDMWWKELEECINGIVKDKPKEGASVAKEPSEKEILSVIYSKLTEQEKLLKMDRHSRNHVSELTIELDVLHDLEGGHQALELCIQELTDGAHDEELMNFVAMEAKNLKKAITHIKRRVTFTELTDLNVRDTLKMKPEFISR
ncbi:toll/interleukin-1 receptor domain-containing protein [Bacillus sp. Cr_A10]|uniref:toll/interleukin-1 receptor domain-containing protein n=1 Tax=Bacillus sp. Cr_A10 TaxID=3033993 RepID=UPI0023DBCF4A|nr:toll/interleukin-1 receptor domain-containing protein [Bacillus sp. Cr_A10]MDF2068011.1 toll/interleukin-1 receptor domain-containing protein [Bacillus sp. Cr_A10]